MAKEKIYKEFKSRKLHLGCGEKYRGGWVNQDIGDRDIYGNKIKVDIIHDLDKFPYPFPDNYFEEVFMDQVLEHLDNPQRVVKELVRICRNGAIIKIQTPHFSHFKAFLDPTHKHFFSLYSIDVLRNGCRVIERKYDISDNKFVRAVGKLFTIRPLFYERFLHGIFPVMGNIWVLKVEK